MAQQAPLKDHSAAQAKPSLTIKRRINAAPEQIWAAWTNPEKIREWWGPVGTKVLHAEADTRVGGLFRVAMTGENGEVNDASGIYKVYQPYEKFTMSWAWITTPERVSQLTIMLKPDGDATILTLLHEQFADETARDNHNKGWTVFLDRLESVFA